MDDRIERIRKALGITEAGDVLVQPEIDKVIQHLVEYKNPLRQNIPRRRGSGPAWYINRRSAATTAAEFVADTGSYTASEGSYTQVTFTYRTLGGKIRVSRELQDKGASYLDVLAEELAAKVNDIKDFEDYYLLWGDSSNANEFDGLDALIPASQTAVVTTASTGGDITLEKLDEVIDLCAGEPDIIICSKRTRRQIIALLQANQRFVDKIEVKGGFKLQSYNDIPIYVSTNIPDTMTFDGSAKEITGLTGGQTSALYVIDTTYFWIGVLKELTMEALAKTSTQYDEYEIYERIVPVMANYMYCAKLIGIGA